MTWITPPTTMINLTTENFKCLQWNARGLTKSKLEEFRHYLSLVNPEVALLSETHWNSGFAPKFKSHHILRKDRPNRLGGGVAILIKKSLQFSPISYNQPDTIEAIGASILFRNNQHIDFTSIYIPRANCETEEIEAILDRSNPYLLGGDFNGHHPLWEPNATVNKAGKSVYEALINDQDACLITPPNLGTRLDPVSGKASTIDLTITAASIATSATITLGPYMGSDHLPIITTLNASVVHYASRPIAWAINEEMWPAWNKRLEELLTSQNFFDITDPATATTVFTNGLEASNEQFFRRTNPSCRASHTGPARPWWDEECKTAAKEARRAFREWRDSPISTTKREEWRKAEARKRRTIITSKKNAWSTFIANLGPNDQPKMWAFVRNMVGNGSDASATGQALKSGGHTFQTPQEKAALFLDRFSSVHPRNIANNRHFEAEISNKIRSRTTDPLNDSFTPEELDKAMPKSKSNATGLDLIHNKMIRNLSIPNKTSLLHLFNTLLTNTYVPAQWKNAVVIPLLKIGKPADDPYSYRPVSLTSNLRKTFERLMANRLHWFLEAK